MRKFRLVLAERLEPGKAVRCGFCDFSPEDPAVRQRYRLVLEDEKGERSDYCFPCAKHLREEVQPSLSPKSEVRHRKFEFFKPARLRSFLHG
jgi:hypothetical protein